MKIRPLFSHLIIISLYSLIAVIYTYPLILNFSKAIPGFGDIWSFFWSFWWFNKSLTQLLVNPFYPNWIFYPNGTNLLLTTIAPLHTFVAIPLQHIVGLIPSFNLLTLLTFVLSAWGAYLLIKYLTNNVPAAFLAGFIYGFSPWRMVKLFVGHHGILCTEWIPFFALFFIKIFEEESWLNALWAGIFLTLVFYSEITFFPFLVAFGVCYFVFMLCKDFRSVLKWALIKKLSVFFIVVFLLISPLLLPIVHEISTQEYLQGKMDRSESDLFSADLMSFFVPTHRHAYLAGQFEGVRRTFHYILDENSVYLGWGVIIIGLLTIIFVRYPRLTFWKIVFVLFFILTLGHTLHIFGQNTFGVSKIKLWLPYDWYFSIPFMNISRAPSRFIVLTTICLAVICGFGLARLNDFLLKDKKLRPKIVWALYLLLFFLLFIDYRPKPPSLSNPEEVFYYQALLRSDKEDCATFTLPANFRPEDLGGQVVSGKKTVNGFTARTSVAAKRFVFFTPIINLLACPELMDWGIKIFDQDPRVIGQTLFAHYKIKYVIIHKDGYDDDPGKSYLPKYLDLLAAIGASKYFEDGRELIYQIGQPSVPAVFMTAGENWHYRSNLFKRYVTVKVINPGNGTGPFAVGFNAKTSSPGSGTKLFISINKQPIGAFLLSDQENRFITDIFYLPAGESEIRYDCDPNPICEFFLNNIKLSSARKAD